jgi:hypothetical protein
MQDINLLSHSDYDGGYQKVLKLGEQTQIISRGNNQR